MLPSELTNTIELFIVYFHRNEAHFTYIYVYHTNVFEAGNIYKNPAPNVISTNFLLFLFCSGAPPTTLLTDAAITDPQLPVTASNVCTTDARLGGVGQVPPPNKNTGYAGGNAACRRGNHVARRLRGIPYYHYSHRLRQIDNFRGKIKKTSFIWRQYLVPSGSVAHCVSFHVKAIIKTIFLSGSHRHGATQQLAERDPTHS